MNGRVMALAAMLLAGTFTAPALADAVFFDDFEGDALLPHWGQPPPSYWEYNVSNSMLNVTGLFNPSHPKIPQNIAEMSANYAPQADFQMDVWMGWEAGQGPHRLEVAVAGPFGGSPILAAFGYRFEEAYGPIPLIYALVGGGGGPVLMLAPPPGIHHFTIARTGAQFNFYLNGAFFASFQDNFGTSAAAVNFKFVGPYPGELGAFHIDRVQVVPTPGAFALLLAVPLLGRSRRRR